MERRTVYTLIGATIGFTASAVIGDMHLNDVINGQRGFDPSMFPYVNAAENFLSIASTYAGGVLGYIKGED